MYDWVDSERETYEWFRSHWKDIRVSSFSASDDELWDNEDDEDFEDYGYGYNSPSDLALQLHLFSGLLVNIGLRLAMPTSGSNTPSFLISEEQLINFVTFPIPIVAWYEFCY